MILRAAIYVRLSEETETSTSPARQRHICRAYAEAEGRGWTVVRVVEDLDVSATKTRTDRPGLHALRAAYADLDVVVVWRLDRLARSVLDFRLLYEEMKDAGVAIASATEALDLTTGPGRAMATMVAVFAEMEADAIRERVTGSIAALRRGGRFSGGNVPHGYMTAQNPAGPGRVLVPNPAEVAVLTECAARILNGESVYAVATDLNARGVPTRSESRRQAALLSPNAEAADKARARPVTTWSVQALRQALTSDAVVGRVVHHGELLCDDAGMPLQVWPPALPLDVWHRLRVRLGVNRADLPGGKRAPQRRRRARLLSGIARCAACDSLLYVRVTGGRAPTVMYACSAKSNGRPCEGVAVSAGRIEEYVGAALRAELDLVWHSETLEAIEDDNVGDADLADVERAISDTLARMKDDDADMAAMFERLGVLKSRKMTLRAQPRERIIRYVPTGRTVAEAWESGDLAARRALLTSTLTGVTVSKGRRGAHGLDPSRVRLLWREEAPDYNDEQGLGFVPVLPAPEPRP